MSPNEVARVLAVLAVAYPSFEVDEFVHKAWCEFLKDLDYKVVMAGVRRHVMLEKFPPSIAEVRRAAVTATLGDRPTAAEAWSEFMAAIRRYGWNREREGLESLRPEVRSVAQMIGWKDACMSENVDVLRGQFLRMYEETDRRVVQNALLGLEVGGSTAMVESEAVGELEGSEKEQDDW